MSDISDSDITELIAKRAARRSGWGKAAAVGGGSVLLWAFNLGRSEAEYLKRPELVASVVETNRSLDGIRQSLSLLSERTTRLEEQINATRQDTREIKESLNRLPKGK